MITHSGRVLRCLRPGNRRFLVPSVKSGPLPLYDTALREGIQVRRRGRPSGRCHPGSTSAAIAPQTSVQYHTGAFSPISGPTRRSVVPEARRAVGTPPLARTHDGLWRGEHDSRWGPPRQQGAGKTARSRSSHPGNAMDKQHDLECGPTACPVVQEAVDVPLRSASECRRRDHQGRRPALVTMGSSCPGR